MAVIVEALTDNRQRTAPEVRHAFDKCNGKMCIRDRALCALEIDHLGLDPIDRRMLGAVIDNYGGGPVGLETLAATIGEESVTLEDVYEPYLMQLGFLTRTPRGRCVTQRAYQHLHRPVPGGGMEMPMEQLSL